MDHADNRIEYRHRPCTGCPWVRGTDLAQFTDADYAKLDRANGQAGAEAPLGSPTMACHHDQPDTAHPLRLCAGWLAVVGRDHIGVRMHVISGRLPDTVLDPGEHWPALYDNLDQMLAHRPSSTAHVGGANASHADHSDPTTRLP